MPLHRAVGAVVRKISMHVWFPHDWAKVLVGASLCTRRTRVSGRARCGQRRPPRVHRNASRSPRHTPAPPRVGGTPRSERPTARGSRVPAQPRQGSRGGEFNGPRTMEKSALAEPAGAGWFDCSRRSCGSRIKTWWPFPLLTRTNGHSLSKTTWRGKHRKISPPLIINYLAQSDNDRGSSLRLR